MLRPRESFERVKDTEEFRSYFGGKRMSLGAFRFLAYTLRLEGIQASAQVGTLGTPVGPQLQQFPSGAIVLGITASAIQAQTDTGSFTYAPSYSPGRRDMFALSFSYTNDEQITPGGLTMAEALLGSGLDTIFPAKELLIPPSNGILTSAASLTVDPTLTAHVVFHCLVPRATG